MTKLSSKLSERDAYRTSAIAHANAAALLHQFLLNLGVETKHCTWLALQSLIGFAAENALSYLSSHGAQKSKKIRA